jgi:hypothetical protein
MILKESDFKTGHLQISQNDYSDLESFISESTENSYLKKILGTTLGADLISDLSGDPSTPTSTKWINIFNSFDVDFNGFSEPCAGIREILKGLIYRDFVSQQSIINQTAGNKSIRIEASDNEDIIKKSSVYYNRSVREIDLLMFYIFKDPVNYQNPKPSYFYLESAI